MDPAFLIFLQNSIFLPINSGALIALIGVILMLIASAMVSGSEVAFFSLRPGQLNELREEGGRREQMVLSLLGKPERLLANILISNNFINVGIVILASFVTSSLLDFGDSKVLGFVVQVVVITFVLLLFGEIIPKVYANRFSKPFALRMATILQVQDRLLQPLIFLLVRSTSLVNRRLARRRKNVSMEDLSEALDLTTGVVEGEKEMLEGIVRFSNLEVEEIMKPRTDVVAVDIEAGMKDVIDTVIDSGFSRIPVYEESFDRLKGILYVKDLLPHLGKSEEFEWKTLIREPFYVPETKKINELLKEFQQKKIHLAIVVDEYGGTSGIVSMEDILEEVVGEITDESDETETFYRKLGPDSYAFDGKTLLNDFYKVTELDDELFDDVKGESETIAGLLLELQGGFPNLKDVIKCKDVEFRVLSMDKRRIKEVKVLLKKTLLILGAVLLLSSCKEVYTPLPQGYLKVDYPEKEYVLYEELDFCTFEIPGYARIEKVDDRQRMGWANLQVPSLNGTIHLSYRSVDGDLGDLISDSRELAYKHRVRASEIGESPFIDRETGRFGMIYDLEGNVATAVQFFLTDSTTHFLRGSLYFNCRPNRDSLDPVIDFLREDVEHLIETCEWKY